MLLYFAMHVEQLCFWLATVKLCSRVGKNGMLEWIEDKLFSRSFLSRNRLIVDNFLVFLSALYVYFSPGNSLRMIRLIARERRGGKWTVISLSEKWWFIVWWENEADQNLAKLENSGHPKNVVLCTISILKSNWNLMSCCLRSSGSW